MELEIENAHTHTKKVNVKTKEKYYSAELSAEFLTSKMYLRGLNDYDLAPFLRNLMFYGDEKISVEATRRAMQFAQLFNKRWKKMKSYYDLFWNNQSTLLYPKLESEINNYDHIPITKVANEIDANMALHQLFITTTSLTSALPIEALSEYIKISQLMFSSKERIEETAKFANSISSEFNNIEKKAFKLIDDFSKIYEQLIPIVALKNADVLNNVDKEKYGIMTTNFEELSNFYVMSYEWILDNIDIVIALNNIASRNDYTICDDNKSFSKVLNVNSKFKKLDYIKDSEPFSTPTNSLKNRVRNAIQHFNSEIDYVSQEIVFTDSHGGKTKKESMYLIDFATLCVENFSIIIYILELIYRLRNVSYQYNGITPSLFLNDIQTNNKNIVRKKIGRNDSCFCGSGKKYKKCCL